MTYEERVAASTPPSAQNNSDGDTWTDPRTGVTFKLFKNGSTAQWWPDEWLEVKQKTDEEIKSKSSNRTGGF